MAEATWIIVTDPGCVPDLKGPIRDGKHLKDFLRELMRHRPTSHLIVASIRDARLDVEDGTNTLEILDGRSATLARAHRKRLRAASQPQADRGSAKP